MIENTTDLFNQISEEIKAQNIILNELSENKFSLESAQLNNLLTTVFRISSSNAFSFSILRKNYGECEIILFDNDGLNLKKLTILCEEKDKSLSYSIKSILFKIKYRLLKNIKIVPVIGPDGVGKTTLLRALVKKLNQKVLLSRFKKIVRRSAIYNLVYPVNKIILKKKYAKRLEKDQYDDVNSKLVILSGLIYYPYLLLIAIFLNRVIFIDRFFNDALLKDISFEDKTTSLRENWQMLLKFIPSVFWQIQLDAKNEIILSRKNELSPDDIDKYRELNFRIYLEKPSFNYSYINTANEINQCTEPLLYLGSDFNILKKSEN